MSARAWFGASCLASTVLFLSYFLLTNHLWKGLDPQAVGQDIFVNRQIGVPDVRHAARRGFRTIIDMRPDGEDAGAAKAADIGRAAAANGLAFRYLPVRHGGIPADAVAQSAAFLRTAEKPVLLYCRTGNRAVRTYALVLASEHGGPDEAAILALAERSGHGVGDLRGEIAERIAARSAPSGARP